jgi:hypothetical protein
MAIEGDGHATRSSLALLRPPIGDLFLVVLNGTEGGSVVPMHKPHSNPDFESAAMAPK